MDRIAQTNGTDTQYFLGDALGSVRQLSDTTGFVSLAKGYEPFGNASWSAGAVQTPYGYTGEQVDANGLVYLRARYYEPYLGRFVQHDSTTPNYTDPQSLDLYIYSSNNPINYTDPSGHNPSCNNTSAWCLADWDAYGRWASNFYSSSRVATQTNTQSTTLINTCGWGTGYTCGDSNANNHNNTRLLSPIANDFNSHTGGTGNVIWHGYVAQGDPYKDALGTTIYHEIVDIVSENNKAVIYLVGHSAGTDATIYALYLLSINNPKMVANIKGVAILDVALALEDDQSTSNLEVIVQMGEQMNSTYSGKIFYAYTGGYGPPNFKTSGNTVDSNFTDLDHNKLAVDSIVSDAIKQSFGW